MFSLPNQFSHRVGNSEAFEAMYTESVHKGIVYYFLIGLSVSPLHNNRAYTFSLVFCKGIFFTFVQHIETRLILLNCHCSLLFVKVDKHRPNGLCVRELKAALSKSAPVIGVVTKE